MQALTSCTHHLKTDASAESSVVLKTPPTSVRAGYSLVEHITTALSTWQSKGCCHRFDNNQMRQSFEPDPRIFGICQQGNHHDEPKMLNGMSEATLEIMARAGKRDLRAGKVQETWMEHIMAKTKHGKGMVNIAEKPLFLLVMRVDMLREFFARRLRSWLFSHV